MLWSVSSLRDLRTSDLRCELKNSYYELCILEKHTFSKFSKCSQCTIYTSSIWMYMLNKQLPISFFWNFNIWILMQGITSRYLCDCIYFASVFLLTLLLSCALPSSHLSFPSSLFLLSFSPTSPTFFSFLPLQFSSLSLYHERTLKWKGYLLHHCILSPQNSSCHMVVTKKKIHLMNI